MNLNDTDARKGISTIETNLLREVRELKFEITKLESDLRYKDRLINELKAIKDIAK